MNIRVPGAQGSEEIRPLNGGGMDSSVYNCEKPLGNVLECKCSVEDRIIHFVGENYGSQKLLGIWFDDECRKKYDYDGGLTINSFAEELYNYRIELVKYKVDTGWLDEIIFSHEELVSEEAKKRLQEDSIVRKLVDDFIPYEKDTVMRWLKGESTLDGTQITEETKITIEFLLNLLFKARHHLERNGKKTKWIDEDIASVRSYILHDIK